MNHKKIKSTINQLLNNTCTRRESIKILGSAAALAGISSVGFSSSLLSNPSRKKPNIVFILTDDHCWDCLGVMGHPFLKTPNMDRLANEGVLFNNAFVTTSLCSPSRQAF